MNDIESKIRNFPYNIILGSGSPRRQELLKGLGFTFSVNPSNADESFPDSLKGYEIPVYLSKKKADSYQTELKENELLITADTIVWCEETVLNKPVDFTDGKRMLQMLSGKMHEVFTGVCLKNVNKQITFFDSSKVYFKNLKDEEIEYYLSHYQPYDKAGSYGAQDWIGYTGIDKIDGSYFNVMGLPVKKLFEELINF